MKVPPRTVASVAVSALILVVLYRLLDWRHVLAVLGACEPLLVALAMGTIVPITLGIAWRFRWIAPGGSVPGVLEALRLTLVAHVLNLFLPAKLGDLAKAYFLSKQGGAAPAVAVSVVVYERLCDFFGLLSWCLIAWTLRAGTLNALSRAAIAALGVAWLAIVLLLASARTARVCLGVLERVLPDRLRRRVGGLADGWLALLGELGRGRRAAIATFSLGLWLLQLVQLWLFVLSVGGQVDLITCVALSSLAILCALVPFVFAGIGARDVAFVALFSALIGPERAAAVGLLTAARPLLPALAALPVVRPYVGTVIDQVTAWRRQLSDPPSRAAPPPAA